MKVKELDLLKSLIKEIVLEMNLVGAAQVSGVISKFGGKKKKKRKNKKNVNWEMWK